MKVDSVLTTSSSFLYRYLSISNEISGGGRPRITYFGSSACLILKMFMTEFIVRPNCQHVFSF